MGGAALLTALAAAGSVGMGCGTCCGSAAGAFFSGYLMTHARNFRESFAGFWKFYLGKVLAVASICLVSSLAGSRLLDEEGYIGLVPMMKVVDLCMIAMAAWMLYDLYRERTGRKKCAHCDHGGAGSAAAEDRSPDQDHKMSGIAIFIMGAGYGITPCAPLILIAGYCAALPTLQAVAVGSVFAIASALSPMLLLLLISGVLAGRMYREIPRFLGRFRAACYVAVIGYFTYSLFLGSLVAA